QIAVLDAEINQRSKSDPTARRLMTIPGVGPITSTAITALADLRRLRRFERGKLLTSFGPTLEGLHYTGAGGAI
ncbi:MAG TPA: transposase, partial [Stellaceae bacterium]